LGRNWSLGGVFGVLLYLLGFGGEIFVITSVYLVMPVGRLSLRHALIGGVTAALLWELTRHVLVWYFATLSQVGEVYGSLTTAIAVYWSWISRRRCCCWAPKSSPNMSARIRANQEERHRACAPSESAFVIGELERMDGMRSADDFVLRNRQLADRCKPFGCLA
jgi:hypothetical protein